MSPWMDMAHDAGARGDEQRQMAAWIEQEERDRYEQRAAEEQLLEAEMQAETERSVSLDLGELRAANVSRLQRWHGDDDGWTLADWSNAMCGEAGEAANVVKKIRRTDSVLWDRQKYPGDGASAHAKLADLSASDARVALIENLANELADILCYADLLAHHAGIDLAAAVAAKFNRVSKAQGFPERIGSPS